MLRTNRGRRQQLYRAALFAQKEGYMLQKRNSVLQVRVVTTSSSAPSVVRLLACMRREYSNRVAFGAATAELGRIKGGIRVAEQPCYQNRVAARWEL